MITVTFRGSIKLCFFGLLVVEFGDWRGEELKANFTLFYSFVLKVVAGVVDEDFRTANEVLVEGCDSINAIKFGIVDATLSETFGAISAENVSNFKAI